MILVTTTIEDFDRFYETFSTRGAEKRKEHGCQGALVFRDPGDENRMWAVFDWDAEGWQSFTSDPDVPAIFAAGGLQGTPVAAELVGQTDS